MTHRKEIMSAALAGLIALGGAAAHAKSPEHADGFVQIDTNADGQISQEELNEMAKLRFARMDADGDGFLTATEMHSHKGKGGDKRDAKMLKRCDANGDGTLDESELQKAADARGMKGVERRMTRMDADKDGKLSLAEMTSSRGIGKMFARLDKDANGTLSAEEFKQMRKGMKHRGSKFVSK